MDAERSSILAVACAIALAAVSPCPAAAQQPKQGADPLDSLTFVDQRLQPRPIVEPFEEAEPLAAPGVPAAWAAFRSQAPGEWRGFLDRRTAVLDYAEGSGIPWIPGRGNHLTRADLPGEASKGKGSPPTIDTLESIARGFLPRVERMLGVEGATLVLNRERSMQPAGYLWYVDFDVYRGGMPVEGARVVFRVNHGNLIQLGTENLPAPGAPTPALAVDREEAQAVLGAYVGGFRPEDRFLDEGSLHLLPAELDDLGAAEGFVSGAARGLLLVWEFVFERDGVIGTWRGRVDASTGELLELVDRAEPAQVTGGIYLESAATGSETVVPMPFTNLSSGGFTNSAGIYTYPGGAVSSALSGQFLKITDSCGSISRSQTSGGHIPFGTSSGSDCATPGVGGAGNTHSARMAFYHANRAKEVGRGWYPSNTWLGQQLTARTNLVAANPANQCNAFWTGSTIDFYKSSAGACTNSGEVGSIVIHEYGHGFDQNDGNGSSPNGGTAESYADVVATLVTHDSCIGRGWTTVNCDPGNPGGDTCTACTGARDIDWAKHSSGTAHTVANFTQTECPTSGYVGPCGRQAHCESQVATEALWDLAKRDLPSPGSSSAWAITDRLWYLSRPTSTGAFVCNNTVSPWTSHGCVTGSYWRTLRAVDDDDGNLSNGTPHSCKLYAAFNRHGIACTSDAGANTCFSGCTPPTKPTLTVTAGSNQNALSWTSSGTGRRYDVFRSERGCNSGFARIANDLTGTSFTDTGVAGGTTYSYQVLAQPAGNEACSSAPSTCKTVLAAGTCTANSTTLCLQNKRFKATVSWFNPSNGQSGSGNAVTYSDLGGFFWFFSSQNLEVAVKVLDGTTVNGFFWVFHGTLTDVQYTLVLTDTVTGASKTYVKAAGSNCGAGDTTTLTKAKPLAPVLEDGGWEPAGALSFDAGPAALAPKATCTPSSTALCLLSDRFRVQVKRSGVAQQGVEVTSQTGSFWFASSDNPEVPVKVLDGTGFNGKYWVFFGSLTNLAYTVEVTDTVTGAFKSYTSPGAFCGTFDTAAF